jgi:hypothetical protein
MVQQNFCVAISIVEHRLKNSSSFSLFAMPPLCFQRVTHRINIPHEHISYMNFTLHNEQNRRQGNVHRPRAGNPMLNMLMCSDGNYNHANPSLNGRGWSQSVSSAIQPVPFLREAMRAIAMLCQSWGRNVPQGGPFRPKCPSCALTHAGCMGAPLCALLLPCPGRGQAPSAHRNIFRPSSKNNSYRPRGLC